VKTSDCCAVLALWLALLPAAALAQNAVSLTPASQTVPLGQPVPVELRINFGQPSIGGGVIVAFDPSRLTFSSFAWDPSFPDDPALRLVCPSAHPACPDFAGPGVLIAFASDGSVNPPIQGARRVGTLSFSAAAGPPTALTPRQDDSGVAGPFVGTGAFTAPSMTGATVTSVVAVPALSPPAWWLLGALMVCAGAAGARRRVTEGTAPPASRWRYERPAGGLRRYSSGFATKRVRQRTEQK
jgi:hypothetical protein